MRITIDTAVIAHVMLIFLRLGSLLVLSPLFSVGQIPARVRLLWVFLLAVLFYFALPPQFLPGPLTTSAFIGAAAQELAIGGLMAFGLFCAFAAFQFGGRLLDFQMGFGVANVMDPSTQTQGPLLGALLNMTAVVVFFMVDGHHMLLRGFAYSLQTLPPGFGLGAAAGAGGIAHVAAQFGMMFSFGLALVAPAVVLLFLLDVGMSVAARSMPQVNMFIVGIPLKIFFGLFMLVLSLQYMSPLIHKIFLSPFTYWDAMGVKP